MPEGPHDRGSGELTDDQKVAWKRLSVVARSADGPHGRGRTG